MRRQACRYIFTYGFKMTLLISIGSIGIDICHEICLAFVCVCVFACFLFVYVCALCFMLYFDIKHIKAVE